MDFKEGYNAVLNNGGHGGNKNEKAKLLIGLLVIVLAGGLFYFFYSNKSFQEANELTANGFAGNLVSVDGKTLLLEGVYTQDGNIVNPNRKVERVEVTITSKTVIRRESFEIPDTEGVFYPDQLPMEKTKASLSVIEKDFQSPTTLGFQIEAERNIFGKNKFEAITATYRLPTFSAPRI